MGKRMHQREDGRRAPEAFGAESRELSRTTPSEMTGRDFASADVSTLPQYVEHIRAQVDGKNDIQGQLNAQLLTAIDQISQAFAMYDSDDRLVVCNQAYVRTYGLPEALRAPGTSLWDIIRFSAATPFAPKVDDATLKARVAQLVSERKPWRGAHTTKNERRIEISFEPLPGGGWITIQQDLTEQSLREAKEIALLRETEAQAKRFRTAINNMNHGLSVFDAQQRLIVCNDTYARLFHLPPRLTEPGAHFADIYRYRYQLGLTLKDADFDTAFGEINDRIESGSSMNAPMVLSTGQVIMVNHQPLDDGGWLSTHEDITEQHRSAETIRYMARHDSLTGLSNRVTFLDAMAEAEKRIEIGEPLAVMCIDLDRFKEINDSLGHAVGDAVLTGISGRLLSVLAGKGITARLGGDEFAALVGPLDSEEEALEIAETLVEMLGAPIIVGNSRVSCGASIGIALAPKHGHDSQTLMRNADLALYRAKSEAPGSARLFEPRMDVAQRRRQSIETGLRGAIEAGSVSLMFQPLVALETGRVACCEALMRWQSPELGLVSPSEFIPVAEETGLINELGVWALETACREATNWPHHVRVSVNVSPVQFRGDTLVEEVRRALALSGLDPSRLELEITESLFLADDAHNLEVLHRLRELGVRFALDDFGTGYSSLAYMLRFPFDKVKIDRAIVSTIAEKPRPLPWSPRSSICAAASTC